MKVFISHSGERSRALADRMKWFVGNLIQATDPWVSTGIEKGARWIPELAAQLEASSVGIVCLTAESLDSRWILFESGALAKRLDGRVCTLLLNVKPEQVLPPLDQFQHTVPEHEDIWRLVTTITKAAHDSGAKLPAEADIRKSFDDYYWPELEKAITGIREQAPPTGPPERSERDMLAELLDLARQTVREVGTQEKSLRHAARLWELYELMLRELGGEEPIRLALRRDLLRTMVAQEQQPASRKSLYELMMGSRATEPSDEITLPPANLRSEGDNPKE